MIRAVAFDERFRLNREADPVQVAIIPAFSLSAPLAGGGKIRLFPTNAPYLSNTLVAVTAVPATGWNFLQWLGDLSGTELMTAVMMNRDKCVEGVFGTSLKTAASGNGTVSVDPAATLYPYGFVVNTTAIPQTGSFFVSWGNAASGTHNPLRFIVTNPVPTISALFAPLSPGQFALTVIPNGNGQVTVSPRANPYSSNQSVTLAAVPEPDQSFLVWSGDASGSQSPLVITMNQSKIITANFTRRPNLAVAECAGAVNHDAVHLILTGEMGGRFQIYESGNLITWTPLATVTNVYGTAQFSDQTITNRPQRFYRAGAGM